MHQHHVICPKSKRALIVIFPFGKPTTTTEVLHYFSQYEPVKQREYVLMTSSFRSK